MLTTPQYQISRDKKSGLLVSPSKVIVVGPVDSVEDDAPDHNIAHVQPPASRSHTPAGTLFQGKILTL